MAVRVEPPRGRPARYPGLTPEERGFDPVPVLLPPPEETASPLWVIPSDLPRDARPEGFVAPLPEPLAPAPEEEGLFDVPGLLERLWLARALEARRDRAPIVASRAPDVPPRSAPPPRPAPEAPSAVPARTVRFDPMGPVLRGPVPGAPPPPAPPAAPTARSWARPNSWVCPYCYLTNDAAATTCRGCRSSSLHL